MELQGKIITILGDSITYGVGASDAEHSYPAVLQRLTEAAQVRNYGVSGTRIARQQKDDEDWDRKRAFVERYVHMEDEADLVIVFGGTNDYGHGDAPFGEYGDTTPATYCGGIYYLMQYLREIYGEKLGACASWVVRGSHMKKIEGSSLPLGILQDAKPTAYQYRLHSGDILVLMSDGVADALGDDVQVKKAMEDSLYIQPQRMADALLRNALVAGGGSPRDDMTVMVLLLMDRQHS